MSISSISIQNYKSIRKLELDIKETNTYIHCFLGKNGAGKSNILNALNYFFNNLDTYNVDQNALNNINPYNKNCKISITFNLEVFKDKINTDYLSKMFDEINTEFENDINYFDDNSKIKIKSIELIMTQNRNNIITWNVKNRKILKYIKILFPIYHINTRHLDLYTWDKIWKIISDLSTTKPNKSEKEIYEILDSSFEKIYSKKYLDSVRIVSSVFDENNVKLDKYHFESRYKNTFMMRFGGENFTFEGNILNYYSDGLNSFMYLKLLISLIPSISNISCKFPIILLDEPEIGLHQNRIYELIETINRSINKNSLLLLNTHSPKIIVDLVEFRSDFELYRVYYAKLQTNIRKLNKALLLNNTHKITVKESSCYFSDALVFVEGESEIQLFKNKNLQELFPLLRNITFYSFDSNDSKLKNVSPKQLNLGIPYYLIIDMDKIINLPPNKTPKIFKITRDNYINPLNNTEIENKNLFSIYNKNTTNVREKIIFNLKKEFLYKNNCNYMDSSDFDNLQLLIKKYCESYYIIVNNSTIEGEIITNENMEKFSRFLLNSKLIKEIPNGNKVLTRDGKIYKLINQITDNKEKRALTLYKCHGKLELMNKPKTNLNIKVDTKLVDKKTSGWVNEWLNYYFENYINKLDTEESKKEQFIEDFPYLSRTLQLIIKMVK